MSIKTRRRKRQNKATKRTSWVLGIGGAIVAALATCALAVAFVCTSWLQNLPDYTNLELYAQSGYSTIYASDRTTKLATITLENRIEVARNEVSDYVVDGTVATEDERFYYHNGVDAMGVVRALVNNVTGGNREGASTITQQLVRNTVLLDEMSSITVERKIREMYLALKVEQTYTKDQILMMYLNIVNYGDGNYGIETASQDYFGCSAKDLTLPQAAMLVGIPQSPNANNPRVDYDKALTRSHTVLSRMLSNGVITQEEYDEAMANPPKLASKSKKDKDVQSDLAPYFVDYVKWLLQTDDFNISELSQGGLSIYTTLDVNAQKNAKKAVKNGLASQSKDFDASLTSVDPSTGNIVAMVGGRNYEKNQFNLATQMSRQAGSSFKPFTLVAAMEQGVDPDNTYIDSTSPAQITKNWTVSNSEGEGSGNISLTSATTYSVNTVYARVAHGIGADCIVDTARRMGITSELQPYESIALGAQGVNTLEMASAYATLAAGGVYHKPVAVLEVVDRKGATVYQAPTDEGEQVISAAIAQKATEILKTVVEYGTGTSASLWNSSQEVAGKTGTSENGRDLWFCGYSPQYSTAVWMGYPEEKSTGMYGGSTSAPVWRAYMDAELDGQETQSFPMTNDTIKYKYNWDFGTTYGSSGGAYSNSEGDTDDYSDDSSDSDNSDEAADTGKSDNSDTKPAKKEDAGDADGSTGKSDTATED